MSNGVVPRGAGRDTTALVGRRVELDRLSAGIAGIRSGRAKAVLLRGPAGIGLSSLIAAARRELSVDDIPTLAVNCDPADTQLGYSALRRLFAPLLLRGTVELDSPLFNDCARRAVPVLFEGAESVSYPILDGLHRFTRNVMAGGPLALVLDDAQWCDVGSLRWLDFLLRRATDVPLFVLLAQRTPAVEPSGPLLAELAADGNCEVLEPGPLSEEEVGDIMAAVLPKPPTRNRSRHFTEICGGNPLLLDRLLTGVRLDTDVDRVSADVAAASALGRLAGQPEHVRRVAVAMAVLGSAQIELLTALAEVPATLVASAMTVLGGAELDGPAARAAVLDEIPAVELARLRARAVWLLNDAGSPILQVAEHLLRTEVAEPWQSALLRQAAVKALSHGTPEAAVRYLNRVPAELVDLPTVCELARALAFVDPHEALSRLRGALVETRFDPLGHAPIAMQFALTAVVTHQAREAIPVLVDALSRLPDTADRPRGLLRSTLLIVGAQDRSTVRMVIELARSMSEPGGDSVSDIQTLAGMAVLAVLDGQHLDTAVSLARRALRGPEGCHGAARLAPALVLQLADEVDDARALFDLQLEDTRHRGDVWTHCVTLVARSFASQGAGRLTEASADAGNAMEIVRRTPWGKAPALAAMAQAAVMVETGQADRADSLLDGVDRDRLADSVWEWSTFLLVRARARLARDDRTGALRLLRACERSLSEVGNRNPASVPWWSDAVEALVDEGDLAAADGVIERVGEQFHRWPTARLIGMGLLARGTVASGLTAVELLTGAVDVLGTAPAPLVLARAEYRLGLALLRTGDTKGTRQHARHAIDLANRSGSRRIVAPAQRLLVAAGGRAYRSSRAAADTLTGSERRIAAMAAGGVSNRRIAEELFVSLRTVEIHLTNTYRKLGVTGRPELVEGLGAVAGESP
ncbi:AAA family ATPase [Amycolatopsis coloradensis]|uniref:AAA family ATPase n=1 Tax=Amycolatopsis coloradensis TaxID=76021 RepID=UPI00096F0C5D|nr:AAA family ATPase [Amycolatopsis coloradensis]